jgi:murein DD-endopeptidase MepM/ murein hydrolase activator NlpD
VARWLVSVLLVLVGGALIWGLKFERGSPVVVLEQEADVVGRNLTLNLIARSRGWPGLRRIAVELVAGGQRVPLYAEDHPAVGLIGSGVHERSVRVEADLEERGVGEGAGRLEIFVDTHAWRVLPPRPEPVLQRTLTIDLTPPAVELLTTQHNLTLGGAGIAVFRVGTDAVEAKIEVADHDFPAVRGYFEDPDAAVAIFAIAPHLPATTRPRVRVADAVGNVRTVDLPSRIRVRHFAERNIRIDDQFLERKVPEILSANGLPPVSDLVEGYLEINRNLRQASERRIREVTETSAPEPLWEGAAFHRQSNSAPMSGFADRRTYLYAGEVIDHQTHLGFDLASVARAPIEAAQNGIVVFAGNLGIYGNSVIIDHGLGVFSLYSHLSSIGVQKNQRVKRGESLGQSGETGLAGGDHLHFSVMVRGVHVDPREWWDGKWIRDHVTSALNLLPRAAAGAPPGSAPAGTADGESDEQA